jgi:hypothetical protein
VIRQVSGYVVGMMQGLFQELSGVDIMHRVEDEVAFAPLSDNAGQPQLREMLRHSGRLSANDLGETRDRLFALGERRQEAYPGGVAEHLERVGRHFDLLVRWEHDVKICVHTQLV